jgi:hypothetical protein
MKKRHLLLLMSCAAIPALADAAPRCRDMDLDFAQAGWTALPLSKLKKDTRYTVSTDGVLSAEADAAASMFAVPLKPAVTARHISWRWQTDTLIPGADNRDKSKEDAPLRIVLAFDGDRETLTDEEKRKLKWAKRMSGRQAPYATLMYVWSEQVPVETVIPSSHSKQVKMLVVASGKDGLGQWQTQKRDLRADYKRAFNADPGPLVGVGVMTDTDNTGAKALGRYAGISLDCSK